MTEKRGPEPGAFASKTVGRGTERGPPEAPTGDLHRPANGGRVVAHHLVTAVYGTFAALALMFAGLKLVRSGWLFVYTEANVLVSLRAFLEGGLQALYPAAWTEPPIVLTQYAPLLFWLSAPLAPIFGIDSTFLPLRLVSFVSLLGLLGLLWWAGRSRDGAPVPAAWIAVLVGGVLLGQPLVNLLGGAQVDVLGLLLTLAAALLALRGLRGSEVLLWGSLPLFAAAFLAKESFVAAPAGLCLALLARRRVGTALAYGGALALLVGGAVLALDAATEGGFLWNTVESLSSAWAPDSLKTLLLQSSPLVWLPVVGIALLLAGDRLRPDFPEAWALLAWTVNLLAGLKVGSSANYLAEPILATVLVAFTRYAPLDGPAGLLPAARRTRLLLLGLLAVSLVGTLPRAVRTANVLVEGSRGAWRIDFLDYGGQGHPLVDAEFMPGVVRRGTLPYLNDTFAIGMMGQTGFWDMEPLLRDLRRREIPFVFTKADLRIPRGPSGGLGPYSHFWWIEPVREAILSSYRLSGSGPPYLWLPRPAEADPHDIGSGAAAPGSAGSRGPLRPPRRPG